MPDNVFNYLQNAEAEEKIDKFLKKEEHERSMREERKQFIQGCKTVENR